MWNKVAQLAGGALMQKGLSEFSKKAEDMIKEKGKDALKDYAKKIVSEKVAPWKTPDQNPKIEKISNVAKAERTDLFDSMINIAGEATQSWFHRSFPTLAKLYGTFEAVTESSKEEVHPLEHDLQIFGTLSLFVPDFLLSKMTDPLKEYVLEPLLNSGIYPGSDYLKEKINTNDPDDVVDVILTINQDVVTGTVSMETIWKKLISKTF